MLVGPYAKGKTIIAERFAVEQRPNRKGRATVPEKHIPDPALAPAHSLM
jgi:hypothetical protein